MEEAAIFVLRCCTIIVPIYVAGLEYKAMFNKGGIEDQVKLSIVNAHGRERIALMLNGNTYCWKKYRAAKIMYNQYVYAGHPFAVQLNERAL